MTVATAGRPSRVAVYQRLDEAVAELRGRLGRLPVPAESDDIWSDIWHQEAHNSTALEGNTLVLHEVERSSAFTPSWTATVGPVALCST